MATVRIIRFSKPGCLRHVDPRLFLEFIGFHSEFFARHGVVIPGTPDQEQIPYTEIANSFMRLDAEKDKDLIDALYYLDSLSSDEEADFVLEKAEDADIPLPEEKPHPVDLVVRVWLHPGGRDLLHEIQDRLEVRRFRSFQFFQPEDRELSAYERPPQERIDTATTGMRPVFEKRKRGDECAISIFEEPDEVWFIIRHGEMMNRAESVGDDGPDVSVFRPITHDVVIYDRERHELRTNVKSKWQLELYRKEFGKMLFQNEEFFAGEAKYTFDPLTDKGAEALACPDVEEIASITLREIEVMWGGGPDAEYVRHRCNDLFARWKKTERNLPGGTIRRAAFSVKFNDSKTPRTVILNRTKRQLDKDYEE